MFIKEHAWVTTWYAHGVHAGRGGAQGAGEQKQAYALIGNGFWLEHRRISGEELGPMLGALMAKQCSA